MIKILVIEDDRNIKQTIMDLLDAEGFEGHEASNGSEGVELAKKIIPDLIICDVIMPAKNGFEVIKELSNDCLTSLIPFIFLSAKAEKSDIREGMELGADDYLTKPFRVEELLRVINIRLKKSKALQLNLQQAENDKVEPEKKNKLSEDEYVFITVNDKPKFMKVKDIKYIIGEAEYSWVYTAEQEKFIVRRLMKNWEDILPESSFLRIHRSTIVNLNYVAKVEKWFNNSFVVRLKNIEQEFVISRRYASSIRNRLKIE
jgi:DNA-binding LytR/AlgR family response regulator